MGINQLPDYSFYWSNNKYLGNQGFKEVMSVKRYEKLNQYIHCNDIETDVPVDQPGHDKLHKIRPLIDSSLQNFAARYNPNKNQAIDEAMVAYKGRSVAKQYIPSCRIQKKDRIHGLNLVLPNCVNKYVMSNLSSLLCVQT